jgi:hypothetical protein
MSLEGIETSPEGGRPVAQGESEAEALGPATHTLPDRPAKGAFSPIGRGDGSSGLSENFPTGSTGREIPAQGQGRRPMPWEKGHHIMAA